MNPRNPYYVLELAPEATPGEIEREGRKILGLLELGTERGSRYVCPLGTFPRDATLVRDAMSTLRDPKARTKMAFLARLFVLPEEDEAETAAPDEPVPDAYRIARLWGL